MRIVSIAPTPSPHSMKINVDEMLPMGQNQNYTLNDDLSDAPAYVQDLFAIEGVKGLYRVADFIALERAPKVPWEAILPAVKTALGSIEEAQTLTDENTVQDSFGEIAVFLQTVHDIPMQIKLQSNGEEVRIGLPAYFQEAALKAAGDANMILARKWEEQYPRYGEMEKVGEEVKEEVLASYSRERLERLTAKALHPEESIMDETPPPSDEVWNESDWRIRYAALDRFEPSLDRIHFLELALKDSKASIRRLAAAYLGMIEDKAVLPLLYQALKDPNVTVRRTAGDCLSDLGFKEATEEMTAALADKNRLVRWRAAMFLYELGEKDSLSALEMAAAKEQEFEVKLQMKLAIERIAGGEAAKGSIWHQMTQATQLKQKEEK